MIAVVLLESRLYTALAGVEGVFVCCCCFFFFLNYWPVGCAGKCPQIGSFEQLQIKARTIVRGRRCTPSQSPSSGLNFEMQIQLQTSICCMFLFFCAGLCSFLELLLLVIICHALGFSCLVLAQPFGGLPLTGRSRSVLKRLVRASTDSTRTAKPCEMQPGPMTAARNLGALYKTCILVVFVVIQAVASYPGPPRQDRFGVVKLILAMLCGVRKLCWERLPHTGRNHKRLPS